MSMKSNQATFPAALSMVAKPRRSGARPLLCLMVLLAGIVTMQSAKLMAQSDNSSITGTITDPSASGSSVWVGWNRQPRATHPA